MNSSTPTPSPQEALYAHVVLDRSGSMASCAQEAITGYNEYVAGLPETARISLTMFDTHSIDLVRDAVAVVDGTLREGEFVPRASTPLYDAIGRTISEAEQRSKGYGRVALVILTDGYENASREFNCATIRELLRKKQEIDGWLIIYLGANQDAWSVSERFGVDFNNSMSVSAEKFQFAMSSALRSTNSYFSAPNKEQGRRRSGFSDAERRGSR